MEYGHASKRPKAKGRRQAQPGSARHEWIEVGDKPFDGPVPVKLPTWRRLSSPDGPYDVAVHSMTRQWWRTVSTMQHAVLWAAADWLFALATALVADDFYHGRTTAATELRQRERILGLTADACRDLRSGTCPRTTTTLPQVVLRR